MSITLNSLVYNWAQFDPSGTARYLNSSVGIASGFNNLTAKVTVGSAGAARPSKVKWRLVNPVVASESSACACPGQVLHTAYTEISADLPINGTSTERAAILQSIKDLVLTTEFANSILLLQTPSS